MNNVFEVRTLSGVKKMKAHIPYYMAEGNEVLATWQEEFTDRAGNEATLTWVRFKNPKKKNAVPTEAVIRVQWKKLFSYLDEVNV